MTAVADGTAPPNWWNRQGVGAKVAIVIAGLLVGLTVLSYGLQAVVGKEPNGPASSSFATTGDGLAGFAALASSRGHAVAQLQVPLDRARLTAESTIIVAEPEQLSDNEVTELGRLVNAGARLLVSGRPEPFEPLTDGLRRSSKGVERAVTVVPIPALTTIGSVQAGNQGSWSSLGPWLPVLGGDGSRVIVAERRLGDGDIIALADPTLWSNASLAQADNAALALALLGPPPQLVVFAEAAHGYTGSRGYGAYPRAWRWVAAGLVLAAICYAFAVGRRFGPPERTERDLAPPRRAYADAMARSLAQAGDPTAAAPLRHRARRQWQVRTGIDLGHPDGPTAAAQAGLSPEDIGLLQADPTTEERLVGLGQLAARLEGTTPP